MRTAHDDANHDGYAFVSVCVREREKERERRVSEMWGGAMWGEWEKAWKKIESERE